MVLMPVIMLAPILALPLFGYLPLGIALPIYIVILIVSLYCNIVMVWSMRAEAKSGVKSMIGKHASVIKDIDPEGKVRIWDEIWMATGCNGPIPAGKEVRILDTKGLVLSVDAVDEDGQELSEYAQSMDIPGKGKASKRCRDKMNLNPNQQANRIGTTTGS